MFSSVVACTHVCTFQMHTSPSDGIDGFVLDRLAGCVAFFVVSVLTAAFYFKVAIFPRDVSSVRFPSLFGHVPILSKTDEN